MSQTTYLIAKYVPDIFRNEPENIGIIVWIQGHVALKFLGQRTDGSINGQTVRDRFRSLANYKQWVESWQRLASRGEVLFGKKEELIQKSSPLFLEALATHSKGNFILEKGGELLEEVDANSIGDVADYLFERLVGPSESKVEYKTPEEVRDELLCEADLSNDERVIRNKKIHVEVGGRTFNPEFSIYIGNGKPEILGQMVPLTAQPKQVQNYAQASAFRFLNVLNAQILPQEKCIAFVYCEEDRSNIDLITESMDELKQVATVVNISSDRPSAIKQIRKWVDTVPRHH